MTINKLPNNSYTESHKDSMSTKSFRNLGPFKSICHEENPIKKDYPTISNPSLTSSFIPTKTPNFSFKKDPEIFLKPVELNPSSDENPSSSISTREDIIIQYCRHSPVGICNEFIALSVDYNKPPTPWYCSHHLSNESNSSSTLKPFNATKTNQFNTPFKSLQQSKDSNISQKININPKKNLSI